MRDNRAGECLWIEWSGDGFTATGPSSILFFTYDHVDIEHEVVKRALASALQRDGSVVSLGEGYRSVESSIPSLLYAGTVYGDTDLVVCDETGETFYGDIVDEIHPITLVEIQ